MNHRWTAVAPAPQHQIQHTLDRGHEPAFPMAWALRVLAALVVLRSGTHTRRPRQIVAARA